MKEQIDSVTDQMVKIKTKTASEESNNDIMHMEAVICAQAKLVKQETRITLHIAKDTILFSKKYQKKRRRL